MSKIEEFMQKQGKPLKDTKKEKPSKTWANLTANEKWAVMEKIAKDLGYID